MANPAEVEAVVRAYIKPLVHLSLATVNGDAPWVCEVHFAYDDDLNLYFRSLTSRRHSQEIAKNPKIAGNIVKQFGVGERPTGVYFEGAAELMSAGNERIQALDLLKERLKIPQDIHSEAEREDGHQVYKISAAKWYVFGQVGDVFGKHELDWST